MSIRFNWDRVKRLRTELESGGWKDNDKLTVILIGKGGKLQKADIFFKDLYKFCWDMSNSTSSNILTFLMQDADGKILYRHRQVSGNEEMPIGGNSDVVSHWAALTDEEKQTYITILVAEIGAYEK